MELEERGMAWVVIANEDGTEGRGRQLPIAVCQMYATAKRLARGADVQGSDAAVVQVALFMFPSNPYGASVYGPIRLTLPTREDEAEERKYQAEIEARRRRDDALERARELGLSEDDIAAIKGGA